MSKKVIAAGHICIDITPAFPDYGARKIEEALLPGKLITMGEADVHSGGSVANTGLAMKILGADVTLRGKIGNDEFGEMIRAVLRRYDAEDGLIVSEDCSTSYSVVIAVPGIDRIFLHNPGANDTFTSEDITPDMLENAALFHFGYPPIMRSMYENGGAELEKLMRKARSAGAATSLDLAAVDPLSDAGRADWKGILGRVLPYVDIFVPSIEELGFMLDRERFDRWQEKAAGKDITEVLDLEEDIVPVADMCMEMGCRILLIKCGVPGMYLRTAGTEALAEIPVRLGLDTAAWADRERFEPSYVPDRIRSGTGAGDTSIAAFLTAMTQGRDPDMCLHLAAAEGACCVTEYDSLSGLRSLEELADRIRAGWAKISG
ncbi:MAG: carbohydrate kinase family protein [Lachnospiraceae bacterium]|nr:carbohydrate kinase family protein [Lachnospiraceae bacterium]